MSKIRVLIVDDHPLLRQGVRQLLERERDFEVVAEASDGEEATRLASEHVPDIVLMDVGMPTVGGLAATRQIKTDHPEIAVVIFTIHDDDEYILGLLQAGAAGYLLKSAYGEELVQALRSVRAGDQVLHPIVCSRLLKRASSNQLSPIEVQSVEHLTSREIEVLRLAARGMNNRDIALALGISVRTVKGHLVSIFAKMRVGSRTEAVLHALRQGWVTLDSSGGRS
jgi:NarL family two-component system response regulator LiaR